MSMRAVSSMTGARTAWEKGYSPMHWACQNGRQDIVRYLINLPEGEELLESFDDSGERCLPNCFTSTYFNPGRMELALGDWLSGHEKSKDEFCGNDAKNLARLEVMAEALVGKRSHLQSFMESTADLWLVRMFGLKGLTKLLGQVHKGEFHCFTLFPHFPSPCDTSSTQALS